MRIIGGSLGGRRFHPPAAIPARPTTDLAREGLFNILTNMTALDGIAGLDLFGGTGGVSYELISRGAGSVTIVEQDAASVAFLKKTAADFKIDTALRIVRGDVFRFLSGRAGPYDLVFADPPYALPKMAALVDAMLAEGRLTLDGIAILEHDGRHGFERHPHFLREKVYGDTIFTFFTQAPKSA